MTHNGSFRIMCIILLISSTKEVMYSPVSVCLLVGLWIICQQTFFNIFISFSGNDA